ncbi:MAG: HEAT repeat domain-containing protein, partial [Deltaproteobacteria bacterium]
HLGEMHNPKIVPALTDLLSRAQAHQVIEATVEALAKQKDPRAIPALQRAARGPYDSFLKLSIAQAQVALGDREGLATLVSVLKSDGAALARQQASDLLERVAGKKFGYQSDKDVRQNSAALARIDAWVNSEGKTVRFVAHDLFA